MLLEKLKQDMIDAMKKKDKMRLTVIRMVKAALDKERIDKKIEINDDLFIDVLEKQVKLRNDAKEEFQKAGRNDLIEQTEEELKVLKAYLPEPLKEEEVAHIIDSAIKSISANSIKHMGQVMKEVTPKLKGRYDMKKVSEMVKSKLNW